VWNRLGFKHQRYTFTYAVNSWQAATAFEMWLVPHWFVALLALAPAGCRCAIGAWRRARLGPGFCRT